MRVLTLNLHNPSPHAVEEIALFLEQSGAELMALTECGREATEQLGRALACAGVAHAPAPYWGNALLSRTLPMTTSGAVNLPSAGHGALRSAAVATLETEAGMLEAVATHLDHLSERSRLRQVRHLAHGAGLDLTRGLLLGDLNALTRADYDSARWEQVGAERRSAGLSPPSAELTGWLAAELSLEDAHDARPEGAAFAPTCPYGTRVDYVLAGPRCPLRARRDSYRVLGAMERGITDHDAVVVELEAR